MYPWESAGDEGEANGWLRLPAPKSEPGSRLFGCEVAAVPTSEAATRELLATQVYRVPDEWLDEVIRVRTADLARECRRTKLRRPGN